MTRVAIVADGAFGIGRAWVPLLAASGLDVAFIGPELGADNGTARQVANAGRRYVAIVADSSGTEALAPAIAQVRSDLGSPSVMVCCVTLDSGESYPDDLETRFAVTRRNLRTLFVCSRAAAEHMARNRWGRIIFVAWPVAANNQLAGQAVLAGLAGFTRSTALELASFGVTVNFIAPTVCAPQAPGLAAWMPDGDYARLYAQGVSRTVEFLIGDQARQVTGQGFYISGKPHQYPQTTVRNRQ